MLQVSYVRLIVYLINVFAAVLIVLPLHVEASIEISDLHLEMNARDAKVLFRKDPYDRSTFRVAVNDNGTKLAGKIEVKGSFTRRFDKKSLLIKLAKGKLWNGHRKISLNAMATDDSLMREWLAWDLIHALGMVAPKVNYTRLFINDKYIGLYLFIAWIDPKLFAEYGLGDDGEFFHPPDEYYCGDLSVQSMQKPKRCWRKLSPNNDDFSPLQRLVEGINSYSSASFEAFHDTNFENESVINWMTVNTLMSNGDTYNKNYFLYQNKNNFRWTVIPWDYDLSLGRNWDPGLEYPNDILNDNFQYYYPPTLGMPNPLKQHMLENKALLSRLKQRIQHVMGIVREPGIPGYAWFKTDRLQAHIQQVKRTIQDDVAKDAYVRARNQSFEQHTNAIQYYVLARYEYLKKVFIGTTDWAPNHANARITPHSTDTRVIDGFGRILGLLNIRSLNKPSTLMVEVEANVEPHIVPKGIAKSSCIKRTWYMVLKDPHTQLTTDITLEYNQENSQANEIGTRVSSEDRLQVWVLQENQWQLLTTQTNALANTLNIYNVQFDAGKLIRFVACQN